MKKLFAALAGLLMLAGCANHTSTATTTVATSTTTADPSTGLTQAQQDARTAHRELVLTTAAVNIAYKTSRTSGLSPAVVADIKASSQGLAASITTQVAVLQSGGSVTSQTIGAVTGLVNGAVPNLGALLTAAHGSSATAEELGMASGLALFSQVPSIALLIIDLLDSSWVPTADQLKADTAALAAAAAQFNVTSALPPFFEGLGA